MKGAHELIKNIIDKHPDSVLELYKEYKIWKKPDVETTLDLIVVHGEPFLKKLYDIQQLEERYMSSFIPQKQPTGFDKFKEIFGMATGAIGGIFGGKGNPQTPSSGTPPPPAEEKKILGIDQNLFIILAVVVVVVVVVVISKKSN